MFESTRLIGNSHNNVRRIGLSLLAVALLSAVTACGNKDKASGSTSQTLARVDGQEITVHQLNEELARNNVPAGQKDAVSKKLLDGLVDRQLLDDAASKDKIDRDPNVMAAIDRAKAQIVAQAYLQKRLATVARPTKEDIDKYYADHPDFFAERKQYDLEQIVIHNKDFGAELKAMIAPAKSLDDVAAWLKNHHVEYSRSGFSRSTVDMMGALTKKLKEMRKDQLFAVQEPGENGATTIAAIKNVKDDPVKAEVADPQIGNFLLSQRNKEAAEAEVTRLRAAAKIEYLHKQAEPAVVTGATGTAGGAGTSAAAATSGADQSTAGQKQESTDEHVKRGMANL